jgi:ABC-type uncharacterized transport system fused permease/ATPase subunit
VAGRLLDADRRQLQYLPPTSLIELKSDGQKTFFFAREIRRLLRSDRQAEERAVAWLLFAARIKLTLDSVYMNVRSNGWYSLFYDALQNREQGESSSLAETHRIVRCYLSLA